MSEQAIVEATRGDCNGEFGEQDAWKDAPSESSHIKERIFNQVREILRSLQRRRDDRAFDAVERSLIPMVFTLGRLFLAYFLAWRHEQSSGDIRAFRRQGFLEREPQARRLGTVFGKVRYWRTYMVSSGGGGGIYPLDVALALTKDGFSMLVMSSAARLATLVSFDIAAALLMRFHGWAPSKMTVEKAVLGLGHHTAEWFESAPPPANDGEVLIVQIDSKGAPTAKEEELEKRRGRRDPNPYPNSRRHRGRAKRKRRGSKRRRKKGDKSKNAKMATIVTSYTLKRATDDAGNPVLLGPRNTKVYASFAPRRHAVAIARREADKRGFTEESGKTIQVVTDGDRVLRTYVKKLFPKAIHTLDVIHAVEKVWTAGECLHKEGSEELKGWVKCMKEFLYGDKAKNLVAELEEALAKIPKTGPGNKGKRERLSDVIEYLSKRLDMMNYGALRAQDLEIATGMVEGAVKHVIAKRFDNGSMRWIKERAEALLQLRCIEVNGDWDSFVAFVHLKLREKAAHESTLQTLLTWHAAPLPTFGVTP